MMCLCNVIGQANHFGSNKQFKFNLQAILGQVVNEILLKEREANANFINIYMLNLLIW